MLGNFSTPVNPIQGSSYSSQGYKPALDPYYYSVGKNLQDGDSLLQTGDSSIVTATIKESIIEFSSPQFHKKLTSGDIVELSTSGQVVLQKKLSSFKWVVMNLDSSRVLNIESPENVIQITKAFQDLEEAMGASGFSNYLGVDFDTIGRSVGLICLAEDESNQLVIDGGKWVNTDESKMIHFICPRDEGLCNEFQFKNANNTDASMKRLVSGFSASGPTFLFSGISVEANSTINNTGFFIIDSCKQSNNGTAYKITLSGSSNSFIYVNNYSEYDPGGTSEVSLETGDIQNVLIANNSVSKFVFGDVDVPSVVWNNFAYSFTFNGAQPDSSIFKNNAMSTAVPGWMDPSNIQETKYITDMDGVPFGEVVSTIGKGGDSSSNTNEFGYNLYVDILGQKRDLESWSIGCFNGIPEIPYSASGTAQYSINADLLDTGELVFAGDIENGSVLTQGANSYIIGEKILSSGNFPVYPTDIDFTSYLSPFAGLSCDINPVGIDIDEVVGNQYENGEIVDFIGVGSSVDLNSEKIKIKVIAHNGNSNNGVNTSRIISGSNYTLTLTGTRTDTLRWSDSYYIQRSGNASSNCIDVKNDGVRVLNIQMESEGGGGILVDYNSAPSDIDSNYIRNCLGDGVFIENHIYKSMGTSLITRNVIFNCNNGIVIDNEYSKQFDTSSITYVIGNNIIKDSENIGIFTRTNPEKKMPNYMSLFNNIINNSGNQDVCITPYKSGVVNSFNNITSDSSINDLDILNRNSRSNYIVDFDKLNGTGFRIRLTTISELFSACGYQTENIGYIKYYGLKESQFTNKRMFSVGETSSDLLSSPTQFSVVDGVAVFDIELPNTVSAGDVITYEDGGPSEYYFQEKGDSKRWLITDSNGDLPPDSEVYFSITSINRFENSLKDMLDNLSTHWAGPGDVPVEVVCNNDDLSIKNFGSDAVAAGPAFSVDVPLSVVVTNGLHYGGSNNRSNGVKNSGYRINLLSGKMVFNATIGYVVVEGFTGVGDNSTQTELCLGSCEILTRFNTTDGAAPCRATTNPFSSISDVIFRQKNSDLFDFSSGGFAINSAVINPSSLSNNGVAFSSPSHLCNCYSYNCSLQSGAISVSNSIDGLSGDFPKFTDEQNSCEITRYSYNLVGQGEKIDREFDIYGATGNERYVYLDKSINNNIVESLSIGPCSNNFDTFEVNFSVSGRPGNLSDSSNLYATIVSNVINFNQDQNSIDIGVGNRVAFEDGLEVVLYKKITQSQWEVRLETGESIPDKGSSEVGGIYHYSESLKALWNQSGQSYIPYILTGSPIFNNIKNCKLKINVFGYMSSFSNLIVGNVVVPKIISDKENYINIETPNDMVNICNSKQGPKPFDADRFTPYLSAQDSSPTVSISSDYCRLSGFIVSGTGVPGEMGVSTHGAKHTDVSNNIITTGGGSGISPKSNLTNSSYDGDSFHGPSYQYPDWAVDFYSNTTIELNDDTGEKPTYWVVNFDDTSVNEFIDMGNQADLQSDLKLKFKITDSNYFNIINDVLNFKIRFNNNKIEFYIGADHYGYRDFVIDDEILNIRIIRNAVINRSNEFEVINNNSYYIYFKTSKNKKWKLLSSILIDPVSIVDSNIGLFEYEKEGGSIKLSNMCLYRDHGSSYQFEKSELNTYKNNVITIVGPSNNGIDGTGDSKILSNLIYSMTVGAINGIKNIFEDEVVNCSVQDTPGELAVKATYFQADNVIFSSEQGDDRLVSNLDNKNKQLVSVNCKNPSEFDYSLDVFDNRGDGLSLIENNTDCTGVTRGVNVDRSAWEFEANRVFFAIGDTTQDLKVSSPSYKIVDSYMYFSIKQEYVGVGMLIEDVPTPFASGCYISEVVSKNIVKVSDMFGVNIPNRTNGVVSKISKTISNLNEAFDVVKNMYFDNLLLSSIQINFAVYNDDLGQMNASNLNGTVCDVDHYVRIFSPSTPSESIVSQRHDGTPNSGAILDLIPTFSVDNGIDLNQVSYFEIDNLRLKMSEFFSGMIGDLISSKDTFGISIKNVVIVGSTKNGINIECGNVAIENKLNKICIINNVIQKCDDKAVLIKTKLDPDPSQYKVFSSIVANNTIVDCVEGVVVTPEKEGLRYIVSNNIVADTVRGCYSVNFYPGEGSVVSTNSCDDDSLRYFNNRSSDFGDQFISSSDIEKYSPKFVDKDNGLYMLDSYDDSVLINNAKNLTKNYVCPFDLDIIFEKRKELKWDLGVFEDVSIEGDNSDLFVNIAFDGIGVEGDFEIWSDLYLRESESTFLSGISIDVQFTNIDDLNTYALDNLGVENLRIHVEGNIHFKGGFDLGDRGARVVIIKTFEPEQTRGPGGIIYDKDLVDSSNVQGAIEVVGLKVYHQNDLGAPDYPAPFTYSVENVKFNNCIVGLRENYVFFGGNNVEVENTLLVFRNDSLNTNFYLSLNNLPNNKSVYNTIVVTPNINSDINFVTHPDQDGLGVIANSLFWCYSEDYNIIPSGLPTKLIDNIIADPVFLYISELSSGYNSEDLFLKSFLPDRTSPTYDSGDVTYVTSEYDIIGEKRIYISQKVDIGPYELRLHQIVFDEKNIYKLIQGVLKSYDEKGVIANIDGEVFKDLFNQFNYTPNNRKEFVRSEKYILKLREIELYNNYYNDKGDDFIASFECYIDRDKNSLFVEKKVNTYGSLFNNIFKGGYVFYFDERNNLLNIYIKDTFPKGCSGKRLENKLKV